MKLDGGIDTYSFGKRYLTDEKPYGRKVKYLNDNGYDIEREVANKHFTEGQILTVKEIYVGRSSSEVEFVELEGKRFNTVMFEDINSYLEFKPTDREKRLINKMNECDNISFWDYTRLPMEDKNNSGN